MMGMLDSNDSDKKQEIKAVLSSYIVLGGIPAVLTIASFIVAIKNPNNGTYCHCSGVGSPCY